MTGPADAQPPLPSAPNDEDIDAWVRAYLKHAPLSLALREVHRLLALESVTSGRGPVLDVGCGDAFWWTLRRGAEREVYGVDIAASEIAQAASRIRAQISDASRETPFPGTQFEEIIGNCSLEHIPDIDSALANLRRSAKDGARLIIFVPTPRWALQGQMQARLLRHAPRVAMAFAGALNGFFQHWHLMDDRAWTGVLEHNGWKVVARYGMGSARSEFLFRLFLPPAFVQFVVKQVTGAYPAKLMQWLPDDALAPMVKLARWALADPIVPVDSPHAYEYLIVAEATGPIPTR